MNSSGGADGPGGWAETGSVGAGWRRKQTAALVALSVLSVALSACGGAIRFGELDPPEGRQMIVSVEIRGNDAVSDGAIIAGLATYADNLSVASDKPLLDRTALPTDARRIESIYADYGYFDAHVTGYDVREDEADPSLVHVSFSVTEGEPTRVTRVSVTDLTTLSPSDPDAPARLRKVNDRMDDLVRLDEGDVWTEEAHVGTKEDIRRALREQGFLFTEVLAEVLVEKETRRASVDYRIVPGPLARVREVRITGNERVSDERIGRRVEIAPGDIVLPSRLRLTERHIYGLRVFFGVSAQPLRPSLYEKLDGEPATWENVQAVEWDPDVPVEITVQEMPVHDLRTGVGATIDNERSEAYVRGGYTNRNFFGGLRYFDTELRPAIVFMPKFWATDPLIAPGGEFDTMFRQPSFIEEYTDLGLRANYELLVEVGYRAHKILGSPSLSRNWFGWLTTSLSYNILYINYFSFAGVLDRPAADELGVGFGDESLLTYWEQFIEADFRDNIYDPRRGVYASVRLHESLEATGSDFHYIRLSTNARAYWSPWSWLTFAWQVSYGQTFSTFGTNTPLPARFTGGGPSDMRGFSAGRMGPFLCETDDGIINTGWDDSSCGGEKVFVGGELLLTGNFELRWYLPANFGLVTFVDVGEIWASKDDIDLADLNVAVGPGLRYYTPFGPIRLDVGVMVTEPKVADVTVHFSIGQAF